MKPGLIKYRDGYKYQLAEDYTLLVPVDAEKDIDTEFVRLTTYGQLTIKKGYAWDGASGPTVDTGSSMRAGLVHDALYGMLREELIAMHNRPLVDELFYRICVEDGMWRWRAWLWLKAVRSFAVWAALPENEKKVITAP